MRITSSLLTPKASRSVHFSQPKPPRPNVSHFDTLPNAANISIKAFAAVNGQGVSTLWRHCKQDPDFPGPSA